MQIQPVSEKYRKDSKNNKFFNMNPYKPFDFICSPLLADDY